MRREVFNNLLKDQFWKKYMPLWTKSYERRIQKVVHEHRDEMAERFTNQIDYVDLSAFGVGVNTAKNDNDLSIKQNEHII